MSERATRQAQRRYNRIAPIYDLMEALVERVVFHHWRERLWSRVGRGRILEVGVGTGKNLPHHPAGARVTGIDLSDRMLARARDRKEALGADVTLCLADAQRLPFAAGTFDGAVATFVFCSVPDPVRGLRELRRAVRPDGHVLLLEHVRVNAPFIGPLMDLLDPLIVRLSGAHIKRHTVENVRRAGLHVTRVEELVRGGLVKLITARVA